MKNHTRVPTVLAAFLVMVLSPIGTVVAEETGDLVILLSPIGWLSSEIAQATLADADWVFADVSTRTIRGVYSALSAAVMVSSDPDWVLLTDELWTVAIPTRLLCDSSQTEPDLTKILRCHHGIDGFVVAPGSASLPMLLPDSPNYYWTTDSEILAPLSGLLHIGSVADPTGVGAPISAGTTWAYEQRFHIGLLNGELNHDLSGEQVGVGQSIGRTQSNAGALVLEASGFEGEALDLVFIYRNNRI